MDRFGIRGLGQKSGEMGENGSFWLILAEKGYVDKEFDRNFPNT